MKKAGRIVVQKAGEALGNAAPRATAAATAATAGGNNSTTTTKKVPLKGDARAVSAAEAPNIQPPRTSSTTVSMMPWNKWFQRWLKENVSDKTFQTFREWTAFMPDDIYDLHQSPKPSQKVPISKTDPTMTHMYRYPAPGSQEPAHIPEFEPDEDPYDTGYFKKDTRRRYLSSELGNPEIEKAKLALMDPNDPAVQEEKAKLEAGPDSSKGNKGVFATGPTDFDLTGLRATMSVTWDKLEESLDAHMPDHLPTPIWAGKEEEIIQWYKERDLPVPVGAYYTDLKVPQELRVARW